MQNIEIKKRTEGGLRTKGVFKKSQTGKPLITVITAVYNGEKYLEECIQSLHQQNYDNIEHIIVDGGSNDKTLEIIRKYENKIDYWMSEKDKGIYDAFNKAVSVDPNYAEAYNNIGEVFRDQGKYDEAIESYNKEITKRFL